MRLAGRHGAGVGRRYIGNLACDGGGDLVVAVTGAVPRHRSRRRSAAACEKKQPC
jgi:hypothetical protein